MDTLPTADNNNSWLTKSPVSKHRRQHSCTRCRHHGMVEVRVLNHQCPYKSCTCSSCILVKQRALMYRSKNATKRDDQDDGGDSEEYNGGDGQEGSSPVAGGQGTSYGSPPTRSRSHSHHRGHHSMLQRASPASAADSPPGQRSSFCPSPWDSKSSSGSSYASSLTPGPQPATDPTWPIQSSQLSLHNQQSLFSNHHPTYETQVPPIDTSGGKVNDFRSLCVTFPDYSVTQLQAIFESCGNDFDRTVDTILMRRWTEDSSSIGKLYGSDPGYNGGIGKLYGSDPGYNGGNVISGQVNSSSLFDTGSSYLSSLNGSDRLMPPSSHPSPFAHNGYSSTSSLSGYPLSGHYSNNHSNNYLATSGTYHQQQSNNVQQQVSQGQYPSQGMIQSHHLPHHQYNRSSFATGSNGSNYYGVHSLAPTPPTYSSSNLSQSHSGNHYGNSQQKITRDPPPNGSSSYHHHSMNGQSQSNPFMPPSVTSNSNRSSDHMSMYQDLGYGSGPRSFAATVVSQNCSSVSEQNSRESCLNQSASSSDQSGSLNQSSTHGSQSVGILNQSSTHGSQSMGNLNQSSTHGSQSVGNSQQHLSLTETMLNQVKSPSPPSGGEMYQQLIADDPLPLNEAMAVPIKRKRGRPKKVPGSPPVKRSTKRVRQGSTNSSLSSLSSLSSPTMTMTEHGATTSMAMTEHTVTTSAIFKVPQAVSTPPIGGESTPNMASHQPLPPLWSPLTSLPTSDAQVNGDHSQNHFDSSSSSSLFQDSSSWQTTSPPVPTDTTVFSSPSSTPSPTLSQTSGINSGSVVAQQTSGSVEEEPGEQSLVQSVEQSLVQSVEQSVVQSLVQSVAADRTNSQDNHGDNASQSDQMVICTDDDDDDDDDDENQLIASTATNKTPTNKISTNKTPTVRISTNGTPTVKVPTNGTPTIKVPTNGTPTVKVPTNGTPTVAESTSFAAEIAEKDLNVSDTKYEHTSHSSNHRNGEVHDQESKPVNGKSSENGKSSDSGKSSDNGKKSSDDPSVAKSRHHSHNHHRDSSAVQESGRRPVTRSSAHRFPSI